MMELGRSLSRSIRGPRLVSVRHRLVKTRLSFLVQSEQWCPTVIEMMAQRQAFRYPQVTGVRPTAAFHPTISVNSVFTPNLLTTSCDSSSKHNGCCGRLFAHLSALILGCVHFEI